MPKSYLLKADVPAKSTRRDDEVERLLFANDFLAYLTDSAGRCEKTRIAYAGILRKFRDRMEIGDPRRATASTIDSFMFRLTRDGMSKSTRRTNLIAIKSFFRFLASRGIIERDPCADLRMPPHEKTKVRSLTNREIRSLIFGVPPPDPDPEVENLKLRHHEHVTKMFFHLRDSAILATMYDAGLRASEPGALVIDDVNIESGILRTKGKAKHKYESIFIHDDYLRALREFLVFREAIHDERPELFPSYAPSKTMRSGGVGPDSVWTIIRRRFAAAGLSAAGRRISPHILRYSLATRLARAKMDIDTIRIVMRHQSVQTTQHYIESVTRRQADSLKRRVLAEGALVGRLGELEQAADELRP